MYTHFLVLGLTPAPPVLRDGIARCLTKLWHGDAYLS